MRAERDGLLAAKGIKEEEDLFYRAGAEPELYPGERNDLLYSVLSQALKNYAKDTRPYCIITSLLDANPRVGTCEKILKEVKSILRQNNKMSRPVREQLKSLGFSVIEDGPHFKLKFKDPRYMFTVSKTPSDSRSARNLAANICQKIDIEKRI